MKKLYAFSMALFLGSLIAVTAQNLNNTGFENWENYGSATEEPNDWNSFKTASGPLTTFAAQQIKRSDVVRPGTTGIYSAVIWSRSTMGIVANGNMTTGQINMGNVVPTNQDNYNITRTADPLFSEAFTASPDSVVFWAKFVPASGNNTDSARMRAVIHDAYDYRDPTTSDPSAPNHVVAQATLNFAKTDGQWARKAVAFDNSGPASTRAFMYLTFTTNMTPGGGSGGDSLYVDDLEMIYGSISILEPSFTDAFAVYAAEGQLVVRLHFETAAQTDIAIYNMAGQRVLGTQKRLASATETFDLSNLEQGIYIVDVQRPGGVRHTQKFAVR